jgi:hypothetical protein
MEPSWRPGQEIRIQEKQIRGTLNLLNLLNLMNLLNLGIYRDPISAIGLTSMLPTRAPGILAATWMASFKSLASTR